MLNASEKAPTTPPRRRPHGFVVGLCRWRDRCASHFSLAAFTGVCTKELCTFRDSLAAFNDVGASVKLGICVDARAVSNAAFCRKERSQLPDPVGLRP